MGSLGWALLHSDWCPCREPRTDTRGEDRVRTPGEDGQPEAADPALPPDTPISDFSLHDFVPGGESLLCKLPVVLVMTALGG